MVKTSNVTENFRGDNLVFTLEEKLLISRAVHVYLWNARQQLASNEKNGKKVFAENCEEVALLSALCDKMEMAYWDKPDDYSEENYQ